MKKDIQPGEETSTRSSDHKIATRTYEGNHRRATLQLIGTVLAVAGFMSSLVHLLGFTTLGCGCIVGRYREVVTSRELIYVEEKGKGCGSHGHRRNHTVATDRVSATPASFASKVSYL
jgi:hypothetical protein